MAKPRGLTTRLCGNCGKMAAHKTLYVKTESGGRSKWLRIFWACLNCNSLNHVVVPRYRLETKPLSSPTGFVENILLVLEDGPLNFDELIRSLKARRKGIGHVFNSDVNMAMQYLTGKGIVTEQRDNLTERAISEISAKSKRTNHLKFCPDEAGKGIKARGLVSLYAQRHQDVEAVDQGARVKKRWFAPVGVFCIQCGYHQIGLSDFYGTEDHFTWS